MITAPTSSLTFDIALYVERRQSRQVDSCCVGRAGVMNCILTAWTLLEAPDGLRPITLHTSSHAKRVEEGKNKG